MNKVYNCFDPKGLKVGDVVIAKEYIPEEFKLVAIRVLADTKKRADRTVYEVTYVYNIEE